MRVAGGSDASTTGPWPSLGARSARRVSPERRLLLIRPLVVVVQALIVLIGPAAGRHCWCWRSDREHDGQRHRRGAGESDAAQRAASRYRLTTIWTVLEEVHTGELI